MIGLYQNKFFCLNMTYLQVMRLYTDNERIVTLPGTKLLFTSFTFSPAEQVKEIVS